MIHLIRPVHRGDFCHAIDAIFVAQSSDFVQFKVTRYYLVTQALSLDISSFFNTLSQDTLSPRGKLLVRNVTTRSALLNILSNSRVLPPLESRGLEEFDLVALFLLRKGNCAAEHQ